MGIGHKQVLFGYFVGWESGEAERAFKAMLTMKKIDVAAIDAARRG